MLYIIIHLASYTATCLSHKQSLISAWTSCAAAFVTLTHLENDEARNDNSNNLQSRKITMPVAQTGEKWPSKVSYNE